MWVYEKKLEYPCVSNLMDLKMAQLLLTQYRDDRRARLSASLQYLSPALHDGRPSKTKAL